MRDHDEDIVEFVLPPHPLGACRVGMDNVAVVVAIASCIAPPIIGSQRPQRQPRPWASLCGRPDRNVLQLEFARRRRPVSLALQRPLSRSSKCAGKPQRSDCQHSLAADGERLLTFSWSMARTCAFLRKTSSGFGKRHRDTMSDGNRVLDGRLRTDAARELHTS